jgi:hypothetical protein
MNSNKETAGPVESDLRKKSRIAAFWYMLVSVTGPFLGVFQLIACFGYLAGFLVSFLFPGVRGMIPRIINVMIFGELPFILWLIIRGARLKPPREAAPAGA